MGRAIAIATPFFFALIGLEYAWGRLRGRNTYRLNDAVEQPESRCAEPALEPLHAAAARRSLCLAWAQLAIWQLPADAWWVWVTGIVVYDFCYYWHHRARARECDLLGGARRPSPEPGIQPLDGAAADQQRRVARVALLPADGGGRLPAAGVRRGGPDRPALPVLDPHRARGPAGLARSHPCDAVESSRASRGQRPVRRPELRRDPDRLGPAVRQLRARRPSAACTGHARRSIPGIRSGPTSRSTSTSRASPGARRAGGDKLKVWFKPPGWRPPDADPATWPAARFDLDNVRRYDPPTDPACALVRRHRSSRSRSWRRCRFCGLRIDSRCG